MSCMVLRTEPGARWLLMPAPATHRQEAVVRGWSARPDLRRRCTKNTAVFARSTAGLPAGLIHILQPRQVDSRLAVAQERVRIEALQAGATAPGPDAKE